MLTETLMGVHVLNQDARNLFQLSLYCQLNSVVVQSY